MTTMLSRKALQNWVKTAEEFILIIERKEEF